VGISESVECDVLLNFSADFFVLHRSSVKLISSGGVDTIVIVFPLDSSSSSVVSWIFSRGVFLSGVSLFPSLCWLLVGRVAYCFSLEMCPNGGISIPKVTLVITTSRCFYDDAIIFTDIIRSGVGMMRLIIIGEVVV